MREEGTTDGDAADGGPIPSPEIHVRQQAQFLADHRPLPDLVGACRGAHRTSSEAQALLEWARTQGKGGSTLANLVEGRSGEEARGEALCAALASLRYYHRREAPNPIVKAPWTEGGLERLVCLDASRLLESPTRGAFWERKFETVHRLVSYVRATALEAMDDEELLRSLRSVPVGEQTADMVTLFWLGRTVSVTRSQLADRRQRLVEPVSHGPVDVRASALTTAGHEIVEHARNRFEVPLQDRLDLLPGLLVRTD